MDALRARGTTVHVRPAGLLAIGCLAAARAPAATLPNELPGGEPLAVAARGACGPFFRPGAWMLLRVAVENPGGPLAASVRVRELRGGAEARFVGAARAELRRGTSQLEIVLAPGDPSAATALEIARVADGGDAGAGGARGEEVVFRSGLARVLRALARDERLIVTAGAAAFSARAPGPASVWALDPRELPSRPEAYGAVDALVIGDAPRAAVSAAQAAAAASYVLGGGRIVFASFRALGPFERVLFGPDARPPRDLRGLRAALPGSRVRSGNDRDPRVIEFPFGAGRGAIFAAEAGDAPAWYEAEAGALLTAADADAFMAPAGAIARKSHLVDAAAFAALAPERPFAEAAACGRTVAIAGALLATVAAALLARRRRALAAGAVGAAGVAWAAVAFIAWREPVAAARTVRVRAFPADGRAESVTDTACLFTFGDEAELEFETAAGPPLPVARRPGEAFAEPFTLEESAGAWRIAGLVARPGSPYVVRAASTRAADARGADLRTRVLARGARVRSTGPSGARRLSPADGELARDVRYLLERFAPHCDELAWAWLEGAPEGMPEGTSAPGCDAAPGSGTLVIAAVPAAVPPAASRADATR